MIARATLLIFALQTLSAVPAAPHGDTPRTSVFGTATIDGARSPGEWDAATVVPVFTGLPGCQLYILNDETNLYLALWVSDASLAAEDVWQARLDDDHDGVMTVGEDSFSVLGTGGFFDLYFTGSTFAADVQQHGAGDAGPHAGGSFYEVARPLNSGDPSDLSLTAGETTGLCIRYFDNGTGGTSLEFPMNCALAVNQQTLYVDITTVVNPVSAPGTAGAGHAVQVLPNPVARGSTVEIRYQVPEGGAQVEIGIYSVTGRKVASREARYEAAGPASWTWGESASATEKLSPGAYFVRVRFGGELSRSAALFLR